MTTSGFTPGFYFYTKYHPFVIPFVSTTGRYICPYPRRSCFLTALLPISSSLLSDRIYKYGSQYDHSPSVLHCSSFNCFITHHLILSLNLSLDSVHIHSPPSHTLRINLKFLSLYGNFGRCDSMGSRSRLLSLVKGTYCTLSPQHAFISTLTA